MQHAEALELAGQARTSGWIFCVAQSIRGVENQKLPQCDALGGLVELAPRLSLPHALGFPVREWLQHLDQAQRATLGSSA
ncbi:MAG: hypothetical protein ACYCUM_03905 [Solirubrobacteraceae bacterium]